MGFLPYDVRMVFSSEMSSSRILPRMLASHSSNFRACCGVICRCVMSGMLVGDALCQDAIIGRDGGRCRRLLVEGWHGEQC